MIRSLLALALAVSLCGCGPGLVAAGSIIGGVTGTLVWTEKLGVTGIQAWIQHHPVPGVCEGPKP